MTPDEKSLLENLIEKLRQAPQQVADREAEAMIRQAIASRPDIPYLLAQTVLIQELALSDARQKLADAKRQARSAGAGQQPGGFLGGLLGRRVGESTGPWGRPPR